MAAILPRVRHIEETLRQAGVDPRVTSVVCMIAERQRIQHQQIYECASSIGKLIDMLTHLTQLMGIRDANLKKLGVEEMLKDYHSKTGSAVESVESFDADTAPANEWEKR